MRQDNLKTSLFHKIDKIVDVTFNQIIDAEGETIIAEVWLTGGSQVGVVNASGLSATGGRKGDRKTVYCNFSEIPSSDQYTLVFKTEANGLLAKGSLVVFEADGYTIGELSGVTVEEDNFENDMRFNEDITITTPGYYIFYGDTERTITFTDGIISDVVIITEATANLNFSGNFHPEFRDYMRPNTARMTFRWNGDSEQYNF